MLCGNAACGCAIQSSTLTISGSGTPEDPWVVEQADFTDITVLQNDVASIFATLSGLPGLYVAKAGDVMTGQLNIDLAAGSTPLLIQGAGTDCHFTMVDSFGQLLFAIDCTAGTLNTLNSDDNLRVVVGGVERARWVNNVMLLGKTTIDTNLAGIELIDAGSTEGQIRTTTGSVGAINHNIGHRSGSDAAGETYCLFTRSGPSTIGSITQVATTGVAYNTTSDERLKTVLRDLDEDEAATILRLIAPVVYEFIGDPGNEHIGFIAQQLAATWPQFIDVGIVTVGHGEPGDEDFMPWMVDLSKLTPLLVAGWQSHDRRLAALEAAA